MEQERKHVHFVYVTMDGGHNTALRKAAAQLAEAHGIHLQLSLYRSTDLRDEEAWQKFANDLDQADFLFGCMIFGEDQVRPMQQILAGRTLPTCFITSNPALRAMVPSTIATAARNAASISISVVSSKWASGAG